MISDTSRLHPLIKTCFWPFNRKFKKVIKFKKGPASERRKLFLPRLVPDMNVLAALLVFLLLFEQLSVYVYDFALL